MTNPRFLPITDFDYQLPDNRIASAPAAGRDASRLLICKDGEINETRFYHIPDHLPQDSLIVFNNTRVVEARLLFEKPTGARIEVFCLEQAERYPDIATALNSQGLVLWKCLVGNASAWTPQLILEKTVGPEGRPFY